MNEHFFEHGHPEELRTKLYTPDDDPSEVKYIDFYWAKQHRPPQRRRKYSFV